MRAKQGFAARGKAEAHAQCFRQNIRHARIELPDDDYQRLKAAADRFHLPVAAYIRMAVMERIERDEEKETR